VIEIFNSLHAVLGAPIFGESATYGSTIGFIIGIIQLIYVMGRVLTFAYYFYIDHGFILVDGGEENVDKIKTTLKKRGRDPEGTLFTKGYFHAFLLSLFFIVLWTLVLNFWYVTLPIFSVLFLLFAPSLIIKWLAKEERNRVVFEQKLDGTFPDESV